MSGLQMKYFVLKPKGSSAYAMASRNALDVYARSIRNENVELCDDLYAWITREEKLANPERCIRSSDD